MKLLRLLYLPFAALVVIAMRLGLPLRFGQIVSTRIGHMAGNMECYLCEKDAGLSKGWDVWHHHGEPCNKQLARMLARVVTIDPTSFTRTCSIVNQLFAGWEKHCIESVNLDRDIHNLMEKQPPHLYFTISEERRGEQTLRSWGLPEGAKFVCLIVRDAEYLPQLGYHAYRDSDIDTYLPACAALAARGYYVFRMGAKVAKALPLYTPKIIDYATNGMRSEFMDVYLGAHCEFCVSSGCGFDAIPVIFRRPVCYVNYVPIEYLQTYNPRSLAIWKHHEKDGKRMTLPEIYESKAGQFMRADEFAQAGITLKDNTPEEIRAVVEEMADNPLYLRGNMLLPTEIEQAGFWINFPRSVSEYTDKPLHGAIRMRIGREFLKSYLP